MKKLITLVACILTFSLSSSALAEEHRSEEMLFVGKVYPYSKNLPLLCNPVAAAALVREYQRGDEPGKRMLSMIRGIFQEQIDEILYDIIHGYVVGITPVCAPAWDVEMIKPLEPTKTSTYPVVRTEAFVHWWLGRFIAEYDVVYWYLVMPARYVSFDFSSKKRTSHRADVDGR